MPGYANPQAYNRYSYVLNNPLRYTDPTGHMVDDDGGGGVSCAVTHTCPNPGGGGGGNGGGNGGNDDDDPAPDLHPNGGGSSACGWPGVYSPDCPGWHDYRVENVVCPAIVHCTEEEMLDYMLRFAYPNQDPSQLAEDQGSYTVGIPIVGYDLGEMGVIDFETSNGGLTTTNITHRTHILYDGKVERTASQNANGDWVVVTEGWGNNAIPGMDVANKVGGPMLFNTVDTQMYLYIMTDQLFRP